MTRRERRGLAVLVALAGAALVACDHVHDREVSDLGPEPDPAVPPGPSHRPGQPCLVCHGGSGPAGGPTFSVGGTVRRSPSDPSAASGLIIHLTDANGHERDLQTNSAGNFFAFDTNWSPVYPVRVELRPDGADAVQMRTHVGRDGSCAGCHKATPGPTSPGPVYLEPPNDATNHTQHGDAGR